MILLTLLLLAAAPAAEPDYPHGSWSGDCATCHEEGRWRPARTRDFAHDVPGFPLQAAHRAAPCRACHASLEFTAAPTDCVGCHQDVHRGELGTDCARCHTPRSFVDRTRQLEEHRLTRFPLNGVHAAADCESCHPPAPQGARQWTNRPTECVACHQADLAAATDPDHSSFPRTCEDCHAPVSFSVARFDHRGTAFPLTGAHRDVACQGCHAGGVYGGTPTDCYACHRADYEGTTDPAHAAAGFPQDCTACHTTSGWEGASFTQHDALYFPIFSGRHAGRWDTCATCHTNPANFSQFSCLGCHGQAETDSHHGSVDGYAYESGACYSCHPRGEAE